MKGPEINMLQASLMAIMLVPLKRIILLWKNTRVKMVLMTGMDAISWHMINLSPDHWKPWTIADLGKTHFISGCKLSFIRSSIKALTNVRLFLGISVEKWRKTVLAGFREGYPWDFREYPMDIILSGKLAPFFFLLSTTDIPWNVLSLASTLKSTSWTYFGFYCNSFFQCLFVVDKLRDMFCQDFVILDVHLQSLACFWSHKSNLQDTA